MVTSDLLSMDKQMLVTSVFMNVGLVLCFFNPTSMLNMRSKYPYMVHLLDKFNTATIQQVSNVKEPTGSIINFHISGYEIL